MALDTTTFPQSLFLSSHFGVLYYNKVYAITARCRTFSRSGKSGRCITMEQKKINEILKKKRRFRKRLYVAVPNGLEPSTSCVTGRHSNQTELPDQP